MVNQTYLKFCAALWSQWCKGQLNLSGEVRSRFELQFAPEPYLRIGQGKKPFCVLLTNPGRGLRHQNLKTVRAGTSVIKCSMSYDEAAIALGNYYVSSLRPGAARTRLKGIERFKSLVNANCVVQFETIPFHSADLRGKPTILSVVADDVLLRRYHEVLQEALQEHSVVAVSAVGTGASISKSSVAFSAWLSWQAKLLGIDPRQLRKIDLVKKHGKTTQAFLFQQKKDAVRGFVLTMGAARWPGSHGEKLIAKELLQVNTPR